MNIINNISSHHDSSWTYEQNEKYLSSYLYDISSRLEFVREIRDKYNSNYRGMGATTVLHSLGYANRYATSNYTYNCLYYYNQLNYAHFLIALNVGKSIQFTIANKIIKTIGKSFINEIGSWYVVQGIQAALVLRDKQTLHFYANIPVSFTEQANQEDIIGETIMYFYQLLSKGETDANTAAQTHNHVLSFLEWEEYKKYIKIEGYNSEKIWKMVFDYRKQTAITFQLPLLTIYHYILQEDQSGFEQAVYESLIKWKEYFTLPKYTDENGQEFDHSTQPEGYLALSIAAACAYAYDRGMKLQTVESDYIPKWMIEGRFDGFKLLVK
jgi:hypothetical protein